MVQDCQESGLILDVQHAPTPLVPLHTNLGKFSLFEHNHDACEIRPIDPRGCQKVKGDIQGLLSQREFTVTGVNDEVCVITPEFNIPEHVEVNSVN